MEAAFATEQAFNFSSAEHREGTNRYTFTYPEHWKSNQDKCDLSVGIRNIIFIPPKLTLYFSNWYVYDADVKAVIDTHNQFLHEADRTEQLAQANFKWSEATGKVDRPKLAHRTIYNYFLQLDFSVNCDGKGMGEICQEIEFNYNRAYELHKMDLAYRSGVYNPDDVKLDYNAIKAVYTPDGYFMISAEDEYYLGFTLKEWVDQNVFTDEFLIFVGMDPAEKDNFYQQFAGLFLDDNIAQAEAVSYFAKHGIVFDDCKEVYYTHNFDGYGGVEHHLYLFKSIQISKVFSRNLMLTSSIAEDDRNNYLGISNSNEYLNYGEPKNYHVVAAHDRFWVDLYDVSNQHEYELPPGATLIMECCFKQKPREVLSRVNDF